MPAVARLGDMCTGHGCHPSRPNVGGSHNVFVNGIPAHRQNDHWPTHCCGDDCHDGVLAAGCPGVYVNGLELGRVGDPVNCGSHVAMGSGNVFAGETAERENGTGGGTGGDGEADAAREEIFKRLTDAKDKLIRCLPEIANAEYDRANERDRIGWDYFHGFITKWLHGKAYSIDGKYDNGGQGPSYIDWNWLMQFERFERNVNAMNKRGYLFTHGSRANLTKFLEEDGAFEEKGRTFDYTALPWNQQRARTFQSKPTDFSIFEAVVEEAPHKPDGLQTAIANTTILALPAGYTQVFPDGRKLVFVNKVAFYIHDGFEFSEDQWLGGWICTDEDKSFSLLGTQLHNENFRHFREHTGYGCDFRIMTVPHIVWKGVYGYDAN